MPFQLNANALVVRVGLRHQTEVTPRPLPSTAPLPCCLFSKTANQATIGVIFDKGTAHSVLQGQVQGSQRESKVSLPLPPLRNILQSTGCVSGHQFIVGWLPSHTSDCTDLFRILWQKTTTSQAREAVLFARLRSRLRCCHSTHHVSHYIVNSAASYCVCGLHKGERPTEPLRSAAKAPQQKERRGRGRGGEGRGRGYS